MNTLSNCFQLVNIEDSVINKPTISKAHFRFLGLFFDFGAIQSIRARINRAIKIFPHLDTLKYNVKNTIFLDLPRTASSWKLCVRPFKPTMKQPLKIQSIRSLFGLNTERQLDNCDIYFYDDLKGGMEKETGYRLPHTIVGNTIKLLRQWKADNISESYSEDHVDDTTSPFFQRNSKTMKFSMKPNYGYINRFQNSAQPFTPTEVGDKWRKCARRSHDASKCHDLLKSHLEKIDELMESRLVLLDEMLGHMKGNLNDTHV